MLVSVYMLTNSSLSLGICVTWSETQDQGRSNPGNFLQFWSRVSVEKCRWYIRHLKKVLPGIVESSGDATGKFSTSDKLEHICTWVMDASPYSWLYAHRLPCFLVKILLITDNLDPKRSVGCPDNWGNQWRIQDFEKGGSYYSVRRAAKIFAWPCPLNLQSISSACARTKSKLAVL